MALATLSVDMVARLAELQAGMDKAYAISERTAGRIEKAFGGLKSVALGVGGAFAGIVSVAGIAQMVRATVDGVDALNDLKDATNDTIENLSALEDLGARTGTSLETISSGLIKLQKDLSAAEPNSEMAAAIKALGLSVEDLKKLNASEAIRQVAVALEGLEEGPKRSRLILQLFGKQVQEVAPFLKDLAEAGKLNATVTTEQAQAAEDFNKQLFALAKNSTDAARGIVAELLPAATELIKKFNEGGASRASGVEGTANRIEQIVAGYKLLALAAERVRVQGVVELGPDKTDQRNIDQAKQRLQEIDAEGRKLAETFNTARRAYLGIGESLAGAGRGFVNPPTVKQAVPDFQIDKEAEKATKAYEALMRSIRQRGALAQAELDNNDKLDGADLFRIQSLEKLTDGEYKFSDARHAAARAAIEEVAQTLAQIEARTKLRAVQDANLAAEVSAADAAEAAAQALVQETNALRDQLAYLGKTPQQIEALKIRREEQRLAVLEGEIAIRRLTGAGAAEILGMQAQASELRKQIGLRKDLSAEEERLRVDQVAGIQRAVDEYVRVAKEGGTAMQQAWSQGLGTLEDDLARSLQTMRFDVANFSAFVTQEFLKLQVIRPALSRLMGGSGSGGPIGSLFDLLTGAGGGGDGPSGGGALGPIGDAAFAGYFATGGTLGAGQWGIAGENGPEPVVGPATIIPAGKGSVTMHFYVNGDVSPETIARLQASMTSALERIQRNRRQGYAD